MMMYTPPVTYSKPKLEEEKNIIGNYARMIGYGLSVSLWTTYANAVNGWAIYDMCERSQRGEKWQSIIGGVFITGIIQIANIATYNLISEEYTDEKNAAAQKRQYRDAITEKRTQTIDMLVKEYPYLTKWGERFLTKKT